MNSMDKTLTNLFMSGGGQSDERFASISMDTSALIRRYGDQNLSVLNSFFVVFVITWIFSLIAKSKYSRCFRKDLSPLIEHSEKKLKACLVRKVENGWGVKVEWGGQVLIVQTLMFGGKMCK